MVSPAKTTPPPHPPQPRSASTLPPTHPRPRSAADLSRPTFSAAKVSPPASSSVATTHGSLSPPLDDESALSAALPQSAASAFTPSPHSSPDVLLPEVEPLFPALSSPPVMITHTQSSHTSLPYIARDARVQSLPASDVQLLPDASDSLRFYSHLSIDTRASSSLTMPLHASPSASPATRLLPHTHARVRQRRRSAVPAAPHTTAETTADFAQHQHVSQRVQRSHARLVHLFLGLPVAAAAERAAALVTARSSSSVAVGIATDVRVL